MNIEHTSTTTSTATFGATTALFIFATYMACQLLASVCVGIVIGFWVALSGVHDPDTIAELSTAVRGPTVVIGLIVSGLIVVLLVRKFAAGSIVGSSKDGIGWSLGRPAYLLGGILLGSALAFAYLSVASTLVPPDPEMSRGPLAEMATTPGLSQWSWVIIAIVVAPPLEEFLFRGVLFSGIARSWGSTSAALLVTALFVVIHLPETIHYWPSMIAVLVLGITTLGVRIRSESLGPAVTLHTAYNFVLVVTVSFLSTG